GGRAGRRVERVVGGVGTRDADPRHADRLGRADGLGGEGRARVGVGEDVTRDPVVGQGDRGRGRAVVDLVDAGGRHGQSPGGDVGGRREGARARVVVAGL